MGPVAFGFADDAQPSGYTSQGLNLSLYSFVSIGSEFIQMLS